MRYDIVGEPTPAVICNLEAGESMRTEKGSMVWMSPNMEMSTGAGGIGKAFGRLFSGDSLFQNTYTAQGGPGMIAFASSFPGSIRAVRITPETPVVVQKGGFLAAETGVELSIFFQKKFGAGLAGGASRPFCHGGSPGGDAPRGGPAGGGGPSPAQARASRGIKRKQKAAQRGGLFCALQKRPSSCILWGKNQWRGGATWYRCPRRRWHI